MITPTSCLLDRIESHQDMQRLQCASVRQQHLQEEIEQTIGIEDDGSGAVHQRSQHMVRRVGRLRTNGRSCGKRMAITRVVNMGAPLPGITTQSYRYIIYGAE